MLFWCTVCGVVLYAVNAFGQQPATGPWRHGVRNFPLTKFYDTPDPLPPGKPGDLIRFTVFDDYDLPLEVSAVRILYRSRSADGGDVAASGVVLFPDKKPPAGGWPTIAWAHDLDGVARGGAPSLARNLQYGPFLSMYVHLGYAIVASDYTGLGTSFRNAFADMDSNALDVIHAIPAARRAVPQLGSRWIAIGTGDGGRAALAIAELKNEMRDPNYLGSIALSPLPDPPAADWSARSALFLAYGIHTIYPQFQVKEILSNKGMSLYSELGPKYKAPATEGIPRAQLLKPDWESNKFVQQYSRRNRLGFRSADAPLLVLSSASDPHVAETANMVARLCQRGDRVEFENYPEYDSSMLIGDSVRDQIAWIEARFAGRKERSTCAAQR